MLSTHELPSTPVDLQYQELVQQNNLGVDRLASGDLNEAYRYLTNALERARRHQLNARAARNAAAERTAQEAPSIGGPHMPPSPPSVPPGLRRACWKWPLTPQDRAQVVQTLRTTLSHDVRSDGIYLANDSMLLYSRGEEDSKDEEPYRSTILAQDWSIASAFVVFNIGLLYSIVGVRGPNETHLQKARIMFVSTRQILLRLLRSTTNTVQQGTSAGGSTGNDAMVFQLLATSNPLLDLLRLMILTKLSQMNYFLLRLDDARMYFDNLISFVRILRGSAARQLRERDGSVDEVQELLDAHCERFLGELYPLRCTPPFAAAA